MKKNTKNDPFACLRNLDDATLENLIDKCSRQWFSEQAKIFRPNGSYYDKENSKDAQKYN